jgi:hypothetical protein
MAEMMAGEVFFVGNQGAGEEEEEGNLDRWVQKQCEGLRQEEPLWAGRIRKGLQEWILSLKR